MSKGIQKPNDRELLEDLQSIKEIPERINVLDVIRLKELIIELDKMAYDKLNQINGMLIANHNNIHPQMRDIEHWKNNIYNYGFNYNNIIDLKEFIQKRINELQQPLKNENSDPLEDLPKWFPIGLGFATGEIQKKIKKGNSYSKIATEFTGKRTDTSYVSLTKNNTIEDKKNIYSDLSKLELVYNHCIENEIKMCDNFINTYNKKLKEIS